MNWVVVGAGSAGCVVARRLVDAGHDVTLIETGPPLESGSVPDLINGDDAFAALEVPGRVHEGLVARRTSESTPVRYLRGRGVGGSSAINAMVALRGDPALYESWGWDDVDDAWRRQLTPQDIPAANEHGDVARALLAAASDSESVPLARRNGRRVTAAEAYLWPISDRPEFRLVTNRTVDRVVDGGVVLAGGEVIAAERIVLSAGAIHTPAILQRSGSNAPGVGTGLADHPAAAFLLTLRDRATVSGLAASVMVDRDPIQILALDHLGPGAPANLAMLMVAHMRPRSASGTVRIRSSDPDEHPDVDLDLLSDADDVRVLRSGVHQVLDLLGTGPFRELVDTVHIDAAGTTTQALTSDDAIDAWLLRDGADYVHASGSCAMGRTVDRDGRVLGHDELFVCDASVFPSIPNANTHLPTTMLAERLSRRWIANS